MLERIAGAVDARTFAVPHGEHAVVLGAREETDLLAAGARGGRELLVQTWLEMDVMTLEKLAGTPERLVVTAERGAAIARDKACGVQPRREVAPPLHHGQTDQRLSACQVNAAG